MSMFSRFREELRLDVKRAINYSLNEYRGTRFKEKLRLSDLIDDKHSNEDKRFELYVSSLHNIRSYVENIYPFLDLSELSMDWTCEELIVACLESYDEHIDKISTLSKTKVKK